MNLPDLNTLQTILIHFPKLTELEVRDNPLYEQRQATREVGMNHTLHCRL